jgi:hypothetical protein
MRLRPVRPNIYLPVVRFGVADSDWFTVLLISCALYLAPVPLGITVLYVPLQMWTWLLGTAGTIAFFNYIRIGRRPYWLQHKLKALLFHHRHYRAVPNGCKRSFGRLWLTDNAERGTQVSPLCRSPSAPTTSVWLAHNNLILEATEQQWNSPLVTTN